MEDREHSDNDDDDLKDYYESEEVEDENIKLNKEKKGNVQFYKDQPYDLAYDINESVEDYEKNESGEMKAGNENKEKMRKVNEDEEEEEEEEDEDEMEYRNNKLTGNNINAATNVKQLPSFDFSEFHNLNTNGEVKDLLAIMTKFSPVEIGLETKLKPYIPNYIPSVGEVDAFIKVNRPEGREEDLGLYVLDEPILNGVDPYIFKLELMDKSKVKVGKYEVKSVPEAEKNPKSIQNWIEKVAELRKNKTSSSVSYSKKMPDLESLMQVWPDKLESVLKDIAFPDENLNIPVDNYAKLVCCMLDFPIHQLNTNRSLIESLHLLFTLYSEFKENQHFQRNTGLIKEDNVQSMKFY